MNMIETSVRPSSPMAGRAQVSDATAAPMAASALQAADTADLLPELVKITWKWFALAMVISAGVAGFCAFRFKSSTYNVGTRLVFNPTAFGEPLYQSPDIFTLATEFQSKETLDQLKAEHKLEVPEMLISKRLKSSVNRGNGSIELEFTWEDPDKAKELLDGLTAIGMKRTREIRDRGIDKHVESLHFAASNLYGLQADRLEQEYFQLSERHGVVDIEMAVAETKERLTLYEQEIRDEMVLFQAAGEVDIRLSDNGTSSKTLVRSPMSDASDNDSDDVSPVVMAKRAAEIKNEIAEERAHAVAEARLRSRESELDRIRQLVEKKLMPTSRYEALVAEVEELRLLVDGNTPVRDLEDELRVLKRKIKNSSDDSDLTLEERREKDLLKQVAEQQLAHSRIRIKRLQDVFAETKKKLANLEQSLPTAREITKKLGVAKDNFEMQLLLAEGLDNLKKTDSHAFSVLAPAGPTMTPESSNLKKLVAGSFLVSFLALSTPIMFFGTRRVLPKPAVAFASRMGVAEISSVNRTELNAPWDPSNVGDPQSYPESIRLAAIRIQHLMQPSSNPLVHVVGMSRRDSSIRLVKQLGACMASFGQNVTVVIVGQPAPASDQTSGSMRTVSMVETRAEDILAALPDVVSGLLLLTGVDYESQSDLELLCMKSGAVVLSAPAGETVSPEAGQAATELSLYDAPILGVIS